MKAISGTSLQKKMQRGERFALLDVRPKQAYDDYHLPGAINIPLGPDFKEKAKLALSDEDHEIIVYGADENCSLAPTACKLLEEIGFRRILEYELGTLDWSKSHQASAHHS